MIDESANPQGGSDTVEPSTALDNPANLNFVELDTPEEEQAKPEVEAEGIEPEPDDSPQPEEEATEEAEKTEPEAESETEQASEEESDEKAAAEPVLVTLNSGEQVELDELKSGFMRDKDYRQKTMSLADRTREIEATAERVNATIEAFSQYLASQLPEKPSPALAYTDPTAYTQQQAAYDASLNQVETILKMGQQSKDAHAELTQTEFENLIKQENAALVEKMPALADPAKRQEFNQNAFETARHFGFSVEDLNRTTDHRLLMLGHYAKLGLEAEKAKATSKMKAEKAAPATPAKKRSKPADDGAAQKAAIARLKKTGSIHDAMLIDFD